MAPYDTNIIAQVDSPFTPVPFCDLSLPYKFGVSAQAQPDFFIVAIERADLRSMVQEGFNLSAKRSLTQPDRFTHPLVRRAVGAPPDLGHALRLFGVRIILVIDQLCC